MKPSPSLTTSGVLPGSCPSRRAPPCCCTSERRRTGGRDGTTASTAWCHTSISWFRTCECLRIVIHTNVAPQPAQLAPAPFEESSSRSPHEDPRGLNNTLVFVESADHRLTVGSCAEDVLSPPARLQAILHLQSLSLSALTSPHLAEATVGA